MSKSSYFDDEHALINVKPKSLAFRAILQTHTYAPMPKVADAKCVQPFKKIKSYASQHVSLPRRSSKTTTSTTYHTRELLWAWYMGASVKEAMCPVCGVNRIQRNVDAGWDGAHIVPKSLDTHNSQSPGYPLASLMVPACRPCNTTMRNRNLIDYMYTAGRHRALCKLLWKWFSKYPFPDAVASCDGVMWRLVDSKFGPQHFSDATPHAGIQHTQAIYAQLVTFQQRKIAKQIGKLNKKILQLSDLSKRVTR